MLDFSKYWNSQSIYFIQIKYKSAHTKWTDLNSFSLMFMPMASTN